MVAQRVPEGLAHMSPGPELAAVLAQLDPSQVANGDVPVLLQAIHRQESSYAALKLSVVSTMGRRDGLADPETVTYRPGGLPCRYAADELRVALNLTRRAADTLQAFADTLVDELPAVLAALARGEIDLAKAEVFHRHLIGLSAEQIARLCAELLRGAGGWTTGQLGARLARAVVQIDPEAARRRYERALAERAVVAYLNPDGTATLTGRALPPEEVAAANRRVHHLALKIKHAGCPGKLDHIKAELYLGLLTGRFAHLTTEQIITELLTHPAEAPTPAAGTPGDEQHGPADPPRSAREPEPRAEHRDEGEELSESGEELSEDGEVREAGGNETNNAGEVQEAGEVEAGEPRAPGIGGAHQPEPAHGAGAAAAEHPGRPGAPPPPTPTVPGVELIVELATLLHRNDHPATCAGLGPILAHTARGIVARQHSAQWRFTIVDAEGYYRYGGLTRRRPPRIGGQGRQPRAPGGLVDLIIPESLLHELINNPEAAGGWAGVIADIAEQYSRRERRRQELDKHPNRRFPSAGLRRHLELRHRTCRGPGCRQPASNSEFDHTIDHGRNGRTTSSNGGPLCRHDHDLKSKGGWRLAQTADGEFIWTTPLGQTHRTRGEPVLYHLPEPEPDDDGPEEAEPPPS